MPFPIERSLVRKTEAKLGRALPPTYVEAVVRENGGSVEAAGDKWDLHPLLDTSDRKRLARTCNDVVRESGVASDWAAFPSDAIAIGANGSGDRLVLLPSSDDPSQFGEQVLWWDHETGILHPVASSFADLRRIR